MRFTEQEMARVLSWLSRAADRSYQPSEEDRELAGRIARECGYLSRKRQYGSVIERIKKGRRLRVPRAV